MNINLILSFVSFLAGIIITALFMHLVYKKTKHKKAFKSNKIATKSRVLYSTDINDTVNYFFPTHDNFLVMDRSNAEIAEAFIVQVAPGKYSHKHIHDDTEQLYYVISGKGRIDIERDGKQESYKLCPTNFIHIPRNCYHQTFCEGTETLKYMAIDCFPFGHNPAEPTWDEHAKAICKLNNWDYSKIHK